ncbi:MAG: hypothetical protein CL930_10245, partial [Deltaproteobacteria bacterium]|nr:hypothetical protein [Deltaproteobacteria bacterium]
MSRAVYLPVFTFWSMLLCGCSDATDRPAMQTARSAPSAEPVVVQSPPVATEQENTAVEIPVDDGSSLAKPAVYEVLSRTDIVIGEAHWTKVELKANVPIRNSADRLHSTGE